MHIPPRDVASLVILRAITRTGWTAAGVLLLATAVMVVDVLGDRGLAQASLLPVACLLAQLAALILLYLRPGARTAIIFMAISVISIAGFQLVLFTVDPSIGESSQYLVNRPIVALCALGAVNDRTIGGIQWSTAAILVGEFTSVVVHFALDRKIELGAGPVLAYLLIVILMLWMRRMETNQPTSLPDAHSVDEEIRRLEDVREAEARAAAVVHDTVLSDLAAIVHGRVMLTEHDRQHLRGNMQRLKSAMAEMSEPTSSGRVDLDLLAVVSDLQWRGLSVEISGAGSALALVGGPTRAAALNAISAALENVLVHAETTSAELFIDESPGEVMVMVVDQGKGFTPDSVGEDRLGLRLSIVNRIEDCGGRAALWSQPGVGTSVVLSLPKTAGGPHAG
ncbi:MAG: ATP-binding protein [Homoserinimonas sp.]